MRCATVLLCAPDAQEHGAIRLSGLPSSALLLSRESVSESVSRMGDFAVWTYASDFPSAQKLSLSAVVPTSLQPFSPLKVQSRLLVSDCVRRASLLSHGEFLLVQIRRPVSSALYLLEHPCWPVERFPSQAFTLTFP
jgi:hypothetical protein